MGYLEDEREEEFLEEEEEEFDGEDEIRELEVDDNGRIRRGPVMNPDPDYFEDEEGEDEPSHGYPDDED
jgi:hypothetical protein